MRWRSSTCLVLGLLVLGLCLWPRALRRKANPSPAQALSPRPSSLKPQVPGPARTNAPPASYRLTNTTKTLAELVRSDKAVLLENAWIDTGSPLELNIPAVLRAHGEP